jgi:23S rRNA pseudouridine2605 synthase
LLLTDDGDLARDVTHPSAGCPKEYRVKVSGVPAENDLDRLRRGIVLDGVRTRPAWIERVSTTASRGEGNAWFRVVLREGRTRQIRRMFESIGHPVSKLKRVAIGPVRDERLPVGAYRALSAREVDLLKRSLRPDSRPPLTASRVSPRASASSLLPSGSRPREISSRRSSPASRRSRSRRP